MDIYGSMVLQQYVNHELPDVLGVGDGQGGLGGFVRVVQGVFR